MVCEVEHMIHEAISQLIAYAMDRGLLEPQDETWAVNSLLEALQLDVYEPPEKKAEAVDLPTVLGKLCDFAADKGLFAENTTQYRDLFDTKLMGRLTPRPSQVIETFWNHYAASPHQATDWFYQLSQATNYIRCDRIAKDKKWVFASDFGDLDVTINLSKPELDPDAIAQSQKMPVPTYPKCLLCAENEGYAGRLNHPARQHHRTIPLILCGEPWVMQYSPYLYYHEHCIVFSKAHSPMGVTRQTFWRLLDFVTQFPHYFMGANAGLPIVGGSLLSHDHFQGGRYDFAMAQAPVERELQFPGYEQVKAGTIRWPMAAVRLTADDPEALVDLGDRMFKSWQGYSDPDAFIFAETKGVPHNTVTPIARRVGTQYQLDLVFRNNITTEEYPLGVYHPHEELHHIKKENIGLIEVMGLAVLPARLKVELMEVAKGLAYGWDLYANPLARKHAPWAESFRGDYVFTEENVLPILRIEVGKVYLKTLEQASVFQRTPEGQAAFCKFLEQI